MASCELLEKCGFFNEFHLNSDVVQKGWIKMFCNDADRSDSCARKKYRKENGKPPVNNMTPTGKIIG